MAVDRNLERRFRLHEQQYGVDAEQLQRRVETLERNALSQGDLREAIRTVDNYLTRSTRMTNLLWRVLIAIVCVILAFALIPPFLRVVGFEASGDVMQILRICIGGLAVLYVLAGSGPPWPWTKA